MEEKTSNMVWAWFVLGMASSMMHIIHTDVDVHAWVIYLSYFILGSWTRT
jgi:hypothetical protein